MQNDGGSIGAAEREILALSSIAHDYTTEFLEQYPNASATVESKLRSIAIRYYEQLREYRSEEIVSGLWEETGLSDVEYMLRETTTIEQPKAGHGTGVETMEVAKIQVIDGMQLVDIVHSLDDVRHELGITGHVERKRPLFKILTRDPEEYDEPVKEGIPKPQ